MDHKSGGKIQHDSRNRISQSQTEEWGDQIDNVGSGKWNWEGDRTRLNQKTISHIQTINSKS